MALQSQRGHRISLPGLAECPIQGSGLQPVDELQKRPAPHELMGVMWSECSLTSFCLIELPVLLGHPSFG